jgi:hypothetical protein
MAKAGTIDLAGGGPEDPLADALAARQLKKASQASKPKSGASRSSSSRNAGSGTGTRQSSSGASSSRSSASSGKTSISGGSPKRSAESRRIERVRSGAFRDTKATADRKSYSPGELGSKGKEKAGKVSKWAKRTGRRTLLAEFLVCMAVVGLSAVGVEDPTKAPSHMARKASALCLLFFALSLLAGSGASSGRRKAANGLGLLVMLGYLATERNVFTALGNYFAGTADKGKGGAEGTGGGAEEAGGGPV